MHNARLYERIKESLSVFFVFAIIVTILLLVSRYFLEQELTRFTKENSNFAQADDGTNQKISAVNNQIQAISNIQDNFISSRVFLEDLALLAPANIAYQEIKIYRQQNLVELSGSALTRTDLINFKTQLEKTTWIKSVNLPLTALISKDNNEFIIRLEINPQTLPQLWSARFTNTI